MINKTSTSSTNNKGKKQNLIKIFKNYDIIVCDHRIMKFLPNVLGELFYYKKKITIFNSNGKTNTSRNFKTKSSIEG